jgi:hypothetical protein
MPKHKDSSIREFFRREGLELARGQLTNLGLTIILPPAVAAMTLIIGVFQGVPVSALLALTALAFGGVASGMHHFSNLFFQRMPEGKLQIVGNALGKRYDHQKKLVAVKYGFVYHNLAVFPIEFEVQPLHVTLGGSVNPKPVRELKGVVVPLGSNGTWWEAEVPLTKEMKGELVEGQFEVEIVYGRVGRKRYSMVKRWKPMIQFKNNGDVDGFEMGEAPPDANTL